MTTNTKKVRAEPIVIACLCDVNGCTEGTGGLCTKDEVVVKGLEREVAALKEYKQRLIADVVTGQRKVA